jgi:hypothetical protein
MVQTMVVNNTKTMCVLLSALGLSADGYQEVGNKVEIKISREALMYAMVESEEDIQHIFGDTQEWDELTMLWKNQ